jgi:putative membrane protein
MLAPVVLFSCSKDDEDSLNSTDQTFLMQASVSNTTEIQAGQLAATKASSAIVKSFGQNMVAEHTLAQSDLKTIGSNVGMAVKDSVDPAHVVIMQQLTALTRRAFDSAYIRTQLNDHQMTQTMFQTELNSGSHSEVKNYANTYLPHIQMHYTRADSIATAMKFK